MSYEIIHGGHSPGDRPAIFTFTGNRLKDIERGMSYDINCVEVDLAETTDGRLVLAHPPFISMNRVRMTLGEYKTRYPESLTFNEFLNWLAKHSPDLSALLEIKTGTITFRKVAAAVARFYTPQNMLFERIKIYSVPIWIRDRFMLRLLRQKQDMGFSTNQLPLCYTVNFPLSTNLIDEIVRSGSESCKFSSVVHAVLWGQRAMTTNPIIRNGVAKCTIGDLKTLKGVVSYAHKEGLEVIFGTVDPHWIPLLIEAGVDGITANNPEDFGLEREKII